MADTQSLLGASWKDNIQAFSTLIQVVTVVVGVVISIWSFNAARNAEAEKRRIEAAKPFLEIRQQKYMEAIKVASVLATPDVHSPEEIKAAEKRFSELYFGELALVEGKDTEENMVALASSLGRRSDPTPQQSATLHLAHVLRDSLIVAWGVDERAVGPVNK